MKHVLFAVLAGSLIAAPACADDAMRHGGMEMGGGSAAKQAPAGPSAGEVRKVDKDARKITLRHGALPELGMPSPMTMVYRVRDPAMLDGIKAGDKVRFRIERIGGNLVVTHLERGE